MTTEPAPTDSKKAPGATNTQRLRNSTQKGLASVPTSTVNDRTPGRDIESPDLMSIDDKLDAVFGKQDAAEESLLVECIAYYDRLAVTR